MTQRTGYGLNPLTAIPPLEFLSMFASPAERLALRTSDFSVEYVVQFIKNGRESELVADDIDHALDLQKSWIDKGAEYVEIFRVLHDGTLNPTIGAFRKEGN